MLTSAERDVVEALRKIGRASIHALDRELSLNRRPWRRRSLLRARAALVADLERLTQALADPTASGDTV